jgi:hypothetical protein
VNCNVATEICTADTVNTIDDCPQNDPRPIFQLVDKKGKAEPNKAEDTQDDIHSII